MAEPVPNRKHWFRFNLALFLSFFLIASLLLTIAPKVYEWYFAIPTIPLSEEVASFNSRAMDDPVGKQEPPITEAEVIAAIRSQLPTLSASSQIKAVYSDIVRTRRLPHGAVLISMSGWTLKNGTSYTVWWINLDIKGFGLRIRENNQPVAKPPDEPRLERSNLSWI